MSAVVIGVTEMIKNLGVESRYCPLIAVVVGAFIAIADDINQGKNDFFASTMRGILVGLTTTGVYAATGNIISKTSPNNNANSTEETH